MSTTDKKNIHAIIATFLIPPSIPKLELNLRLFIALKHPNNVSNDIVKITNFINICSDKKDIVIFITPPRFI
ncbi:hypothetical protein QQI_0636 [Clostridioides difficile Y401]|nr:hypothetical protein QIG_0644 [Clostridioides difficile DA00065]EQI86950.1 hypothetical protein QQI_0636 [Clostridioides difficile Y401]EQL10330.1 hypothetical protein QE3_0768 [Clostridioides difficile CD88]